MKLTKAPGLARPQINKHYAINLSILTMAKTHISDSEASGHTTASISEGEDDSRQLPRASALASSPSQSESEEQSSHDHAENQHGQNVSDFEIRVPPPPRPWEYTKFPASIVVEKILGETNKPGREVLYRIEYEDGLEEEVGIQYFALETCYRYICVECQSLR
jgi:hypothetical protein